MTELAAAKQETLYRPLLQMALFCERVLREADGVISIIRVVDRINVSGPAPEMPPTSANLTIVIGFKSGFMRGKARVRLTPLTPSGKQLPTLEFPLLFEGDDRGAALVAQMTLVLSEEGLYWFEVFVETDLVTRMPLRVLYQRVGFAEPGRG